MEKKSPSEDNNCADAEHVAAFRDYRAAYPEWQTAGAPHAFSHGFREGMAQAMKQHLAREKMLVAKAREEGYSRGWIAGRNSYESGEDLP